MVARPQPPTKPNALPFASQTRRRFLVAGAYGVAHVAVVGLPPFSLRSRPSAPTEPQGLRPASEGQGVKAISQEVAAFADAPPEPGPDHIHDLVIVNGRVIDPATSYDGIANIGIDGGMIVSITPQPVQGRDTIDASGHVVAPGFIDILSYEPNSFGAWYKLADGVTTNLAMHGVANYAPAFFSRYAGESPVHFGGAYHQHFMRFQEIGVGVEDKMGGAQIDVFARALETNLRQGFAGVSFSPEYSPGTSLDEMTALASVVARHGQVAFFHVRHSDPEPPGTSLEAIEEVIEIVRRTGVSAHIEHISSTGGTFVMEEALGLIEEARAANFDITACVYPYNYWGTFLASTRFAAGWQERYRISFEDLQVAGTDQRLTEGTYAAAKADNLLVAALGSIPETDITTALAKPWVMIGSDAILKSELNNHPRAAGTFARTLRRYVREEPVLTLQEALAKMTILPAQRTEKMIPAMARKGRLWRGADADVVVFNPDTVSDRATVAEPKQPSVGIQTVVVNGQVALRGGLALRAVRAGTPLLGSAGESANTGDRVSPSDSLRQETSTGHLGE